LRGCLGGTQNEQQRTKRTNDDDSPAPQDLVKTLITKGGMDPLEPAVGLKSLVSSRLEHVRGPDALWMAKRRGHKPIVKCVSVVS
jgi:hypothetical protein